MGNSSSQEEEARRASNSHHKRSGHASQQASNNSNKSTTATQNPIGQPDDESIPNVKHDFDQQQDVYVSDYNNNAGNPGILPKPPTTTTSTTTQVYRESSFNHVENTQSSQETHEEPGSRPQLGSRQKSAIVLETDHDVEEGFEKMKLSEGNRGEGDNSNHHHHHNNNLNADVTLSRANSGQEIDLGVDYEEEEQYDTKIEWREGGNKVYVTGSFTGWTKMIKLHKQHDNNNEGEVVFSTIIKLPAGTHRLRFLVDNEIKCSDYLPSATDSMGNLVNYIEIGPEVQLEDERPSQRLRLERTATIGLSDDEDDLGESFERLKDDEAVVDKGEPELEYGTEIPQVFTNPEVMDKFVSSDFVTPPVLPPHLEGVILNSDSTEKDNNSILPIPNHVVLNHLATTSIKHNVLAVASISRYSRKYVTQILYAPLQ